MSNKHTQALKTCFYNISNRHFLDNVLNMIIPIHSIISVQRNFVVLTLCMVLLPSCNP